MIKLVKKEDKITVAVYCFTCDELVEHFILLSPPQWIDPNHEETIYICLDCVKNIFEKTK